MDLFSSVIWVKLWITLELLENVTIAKLSVELLIFTKYSKEFFTNSIGVPLILPDTSTIQIKSTGFAFSVISSVDKDTTNGVYLPDLSSCALDLSIVKVEALDKPKRIGKNKERYSNFFLIFLTTFYFIY